MWIGEVAEANGAEGDDGVVETIKVCPAALYVIEHERGQHNEEPSPCHQGEEWITLEPPAETSFSSFHEVKHLEEKLHQLI